MSSSSVAPAIIYLGLDVHKDSVTIAVLPADATAPTRIDKFPNDFAKLRRVFERHAKDGEIRACYEARGAGYVLQRAMREWGYYCDVIAPSLIPVKPGVQRKHIRTMRDSWRGCIGTDYKLPLWALTTAELEFVEIYLPSRTGGDASTSIGGHPTKFKTGTSMRPGAASGCGNLALVVWLKQ